MMNKFKWCRASMIISEKGRQSNLKEKNGNKKILRKVNKRNIE